VCVRLLCVCVCVCAFFSVVLYIFARRCFVLIVTIACVSSFEATHVFTVCIGVCVCVIARLCVCVCVCVIARLCVCV